MSESSPGGLGFDTRLRQTFCRAIFLFSTLMHVRKVNSGLRKKSSVSTGVRSQETHRCVTNRNDMTLPTEMALNFNTKKQS